MVTIRLWCRLGQISPDNFSGSNIPQDNLTRPEDRSHDTAVGRHGQRGDVGLEVEDPDTGPIASTPHPAGHVLAGRDDVAPVRVEGGVGDGAGVPGQDPERLRAVRPPELAGGVVGGAAEVGGHRGEAGVVDRPLGVSGVLVDHAVSVQVPQDNEAVHGTAEGVLPASLYIHPVDGPRVPPQLTVDLLALPTLHCEMFVVKQPYFGAW